MPKHCIPFLITLLISGAVLFSGCPSNSGSEANNTASTETETTTFKRGSKNEVIVHELSDPDKLNVLTSTGASATYVKYNIFMYLLDVNKETLEPNPSLAKERPVIKELTEGEFAGGLSIAYEIRPEAQWDNGDPVTGHDVAFTLKALKNPHVDAEHLRPYLEFITHIEVDPENPKRFTFYCDRKYLAAESSSGYQAFVAPEHVYDPKGIMRDYTLKELSDPDNMDAMRSDAKLLEFGRAFNSEKYQREKGFVVGCGPYEFEEWVTGQRVVLKKKDNWWGDQLAGKVPNFEAWPDKIVYEIINDRTTALSAMKDESIDVSRSLRPKDFDDLRKDDAFQNKFHLFKPTSLSYTYIGLNMKHPILSDVRVRSAFAHLVDKQQIIDVLNYGLAAPTSGPIHPSKPYYNDQLEPYDFNIKRAGEILEEAGWKDTDGDGLRDKVINGKKTPLKLVFKYNSGNDTREKIGLFLKENARKVGADLEIIAKEWTVFLDETKNHDFDLYCGGWIQDPLEDDPKQIWHTDGYNGGSNYVGFGNEQTDELIESLRAEMDGAKRHELYLELQREIHEQAPYIFLYTPTARLVISKRFDNVHPYVARPGYTEREFKVSSPKMQM